MSGWIDVRKSQPEATKKVGGWKESEPVPVLVEGVDEWMVGTWQVFSTHSEWRIHGYKTDKRVTHYCELPERPA